MKKLIIFSCLCATLIMGCSKDLLDKKNPNAVGVDLFWKTEADVLAAVGATYNLLRNVNTGYWGVRGVELSNGRGDDFFIRNDVKDLYSLSTFTNNPDNGTLNGLWNGAFQSIFRANQILAHADDEIEGVDDTERKQIKAEAQFLRGLNYFILVTNFGDVPLRLTVPASATEYPIAKSPEADVWKQVEADFTAAAADLPVAWPAEYTGRATKGAAIGYLGKTYLYQQQWPKAETTLKQLMEAPYTYNLTPLYEDNFKATRENNEESVFEIQIQDVGGTGPWTAGAGESIGVTTAQEFAPSEVSGWFEAYPTNKILDEFKKEKTTDNDFDPRMYATLVWSGQEGTFYKKPISAFFPTEFGYLARFKKYQNWQNENELKGTGGGDYTSNINERALRFADVLLMYAEAVTMQGRQGEAYPAVKRIRDRAKLPELAAGLTQDLMMAEIRHQRMIEFCREGLRFYDLKRWGLIKQELDNSDKVGRNFYVSPKHNYYPVPQAELDANGQMVQNDSW